MSGTAAARRPGGRCTFPSRSCTIRRARSRATNTNTHVVDDWDHDKVLSAFTGIGRYWLGTEVGVYERLTH